MNKANHKLIQRVLSITFLFFLLLASTVVSLEAQTYGINWTKGNVTASVDFRDILWTGSKFVTVGYYGHFYSSADGKTWNKGSTGLDKSIALFGIANNGPNTLVAAGENHIIIRSTNAGASWEVVHPMASTNVEEIYSVAYGNGTFVAVDHGGGVWRSADGKNGWTRYASGYSTRRIYFANGIFLVGCSGAGAIYRSASGAKGTWTKVGTLGAPVRDLHYGNGKWIAVGHRIGTSSSANGSNWTTHIKLGDYCFVDQLYSVTTAPGSFIAAGEHGLMLISSNGITWRQATSGTKRFILGMAYANNTVAAVGGGGHVVGRDDAFYLHSTRYSLEGGTPPDPLEEGCSKITVTSPNGGEKWEVGSTHNITWTSQGTVGNVTLEYSTNGGQSYTVFDAIAKNDGVRPWVIPNTPSSKCRVRITDAGNGAIKDTSNSNFSIVPEGGGSPDGTITVTSPNGGEEWEIGSAHDITWTSTGTVGNVKLEYTTNNGSSWILFDAVAKNDGVRPWEVPETISSNCKIRITSVDNSSISDTSNSTFSIVDPGPSTLTLIDPNGGETWSAGSGHSILWTSTGFIGTVKLEYSPNNGSSWTTIESSTHNDGGYSWFLPTGTTSECLVRVTSNSKPDVFDTSDDIFSIVPPPGSPTIVVVSPNGGEEWESESTQTIKWASSESISTVKIDYTTDDGGQWTQITDDAPNNGTYSWAVPDDPSSQCKIRITDASGSTPTDTSNTTFTIFEPEPAQIALNRTQFNFGFALGGNIPGSQPLAVSNDGGKALSWSASGDQEWINLNPISGNGGTLVDISIDPGGMGVGQYSGTVTVSDPDATNSPQTITVNLNVFNASDDQAPFGDMASPDDGLIASGSIPVTGWVLDDVDIQSVTLYYNETSIIGDAVFVEGARPDIEETYPGYPRNARAGWGYMLLTNSLPDGAYSLYAVATDINGKTTMFGPSNITINNAGAVKPFGAINTPFQGGDASGDNYVNWGWALTPQPNTVPKDGSTIQVWVDGDLKGMVDGYDVPNADVAALFPDYQNSTGPTGYFHLDTTEYTNGVHYIAWTVADDAGNTEGIGSRYFNILNSSGGASRVSNTASGPGGFIVDDLSGLPVDGFTPLRIKKGFQPTAEAQMVSPDEKGKIYLEFNELEPIEIQLTNGLPLKLKGYMKVGEDYRPLPVGSTLDALSGTFSWHPGPGFMKDYQLVFVIKNESGEFVKKQIHLRIVPKSTGVRNEK